MKPSKEIAQITKAVADILVPSCQERIERIFKEIERSRGDSHLVTPWGDSFDISWEDWERIKADEGVVRIL